MLAIFKRELKSYFLTPLGYVFLAVFYLIAGFYWFATCLVYGITDSSALFSNLFVVTLFIVPILTMRLFSEEKKQGTQKLLLTSPVSAGGIVAGKYFSALLTYSAGLAITFVYALVMGTHGYVYLPVFLCNCLGLFLTAAALLAIGMFISALTDSQLVAAVAGFATSLLVFVIDGFAAVVPNVVGRFVRSLSFFNRYEPFTVGIIDAASVVFFISVAALFGFLTARALERRR